MKMKITAAALIMASIGTGAAASQCGFLEKQYYVDWTSFAHLDADPTGRPTRAYAFPVDEGAVGRTSSHLNVYFSYGGQIQKFIFDSPKVQKTQGALGGAMSIGQNLSEPYEMTETRISFDQPVRALTLEIHDVDDNAHFNTSYDDQLSVIGVDGNIKLHHPAIEILGAPQYEARTLADWHEDRGFGPTNIYPVDISAAGGSGFASFRATFQEDVKSAAIRLTSATNRQSQYSASQNPSPQEITLGRLTFCLK